MSNETSFLKANYCRSVMRTASTASDADARRLVQGLTTEIPTADITSDVADKEHAALVAIRTLADQLYGRNDAGRAEWTKAGRAVERWIISAS